ncbi:hypothetical protein Q8A67_019282 [Cirrhinus molitorella]|uniref:Uncharacterized protein n=1 Tax=Cirrhinus molitorella TaxID=172907 RepID=A0AA88PLA8_9TELE|nr:hypothetical protein Q8A67_019282 [Cirrhinus molitorella]
MSEAPQQSYKPEKISVPHGHKQNAFCFSLLMNGASEHCSQTRGIQNPHEMPTWWTILILLVAFWTSIC